MADSIPSYANSLIDLASQFAGERKGPPATAAPHSDKSPSDIAQKPAASLSSIADVSLSKENLEAATLGGKQFQSIELAPK